ncbi:uncharacterized protein LOC136080284 [Hydra vulgaris]|uniref:Uncharacterized protein LOC136080284 n=1 Tax=Hydra vulgaris TaxID=6087 RepID=A0ABM4BUW7_HYDVU
MAVPADESFEDFFNCETLSDRILYIVEVEECPNSYNNYKSSHSELYKRKKKSISSEESISSEPKRAKISPTINNIEYEDDDTVDKELFEFTDTLSEQENLEEQDAPLVTIKQEECTEIGSVVPNNAASPFIVKNLELNIEPEFSVDDMIKSVNQSSEVTLQVLHKTMSGDMPLASGLQTPKQVNLFASRSSPCYVHSSVKTELIHDSNTECLLKPSKIEQPKSKRIIKETKVYVHSVILAAKSEFFKLLLSTSGMKETKEKDVRIEFLMCSNMKWSSFALSLKNAIRFYKHEETDTVKACNFAEWRFLNEKEFWLMELEMIAHLSSGQVSISEKREKMQSCNYKDSDSVRVLSLIDIQKLYCDNCLK